MQDIFSVSGVGPYHEYCVFQGHVSCCTASRCTVYIRDMSLAVPHHNALYISGACVLLRARFSIFQGLGHIMNTVYFRSMSLVVLHHDIPYTSAACLLFHIMMHYIFQGHVSLCHIMMYQLFQGPGHCYGRGYLWARAGSNLAEQCSLYRVRTAHRIVQHLSRGR